MSHKRKGEGASSINPAGGQQHPGEVMHATSGSEMEIEYRVLMKGNVMAARTSLFDVFQYNSWIKKSNYEGIFNAIIFIFIWTIIHKPAVITYSLYLYEDIDELHKDGQSIRP